MSITKPQLNKTMLTIVTEAVKSSYKYYQEANNINNLDICTKSEIEGEGLHFFDEQGRPCKPENGQVYAKCPWEPQHYYDPQKAITEFPKMKWSFFCTLCSILGVQKIDYLHEDKKKHIKNLSINVKTCGESGKANKDQAVALKTEIEKQIEENEYSSRTFNGKFDRPMKKDLYQKASEYLLEHNLSNDSEFKPILEFRKSDGRSLLNHLETLYHTYSEQTQILKISAGIDIARVALGRNPATRLVSKLFSFNIDFDFAIEVKNTNEMTDKLTLDFWSNDDNPA
jgi:hypothetical protein